MYPHRRGIRFVFDMASDVLSFFLSFFLSSLIPSLLLSPGREGGESEGERERESNTKRIPLLWGYVIIGVMVQTLSRIANGMLTQRGTTGQIKCGVMCYLSCTHYESSLSVKVKAG